MQANCSMNFRVVYSNYFKHNARTLTKKYRSLEADMKKLISSLKSDPKQGTAIGRSCYKIRLAITSKGKGKSGGARVITNIHVAGQVVYLLSIYDKSEQDNIGEKAITAILDTLDV